MATEFEIVDLWVGRFPSAEAADAYFAETYGEDDRPISRFAADMGDRFYDHDFVEREFHDPPAEDLAAALTGHSFSSSYLAPAVEAAGPNLPTPFNVVLLVFNREIERPVSVRTAAFSLVYVGRFECDPDAPPAG